jgi:metal-responsive CopG/Arc/MetJ family transcriptional regulator
LWFYVKRGETTMVVNIRLDQTTVAEVDAIAAQEERSRSSVLDRLIRAALEARRTAPRQAAAAKRRAKRLPL